MRIVFSSLWVLVLTGAALAEADVTVIDSLAGPWEFSDAAGKTCRVSFSKEAAVHGFAATVEETCKSVWPSAVDISGWTILEDGSLRLLDPLGKSLMDFSEADNGLYQHLTDGTADYSLVNVDETDFTESPSAP